MNVLRSAFLILVILVFAGPLSAAQMMGPEDWKSNPEIAWEEIEGETALTITFDFSEMSDPPTPSHYPTRFQIQTSPDGVDWTKRDPVGISPRPTTTLFDVTYDLGDVSGTLQILARLECVIHGWSIWSEAFTITPGGNPAEGGAQEEKTTITKTVTTTTTSTTTRSTTTTVTQETTSLLTTTQRETLTETTTTTFTEEVPIIESSALAPLGVGIAVAGIAIAIVLTRRK